MQIDCKTNVDYMNTEERKCKLYEIYNELIEAGIITNKKDFAELIGSNYNCLTQAMNGVERYLTDSLINKARQAKVQSMQAVAVTNSPGAVVTNGDHNNVEVSKPSTVSALAVPYQDMRCVPTIPIHAYRAINFDVMDYFRKTKDELRMSPIIMQFPSTDCYYFVNSEDMTPHLHTNDLLCLSRLPDEAKVTNGDICIINTKYQGIIERFVYDEGDHLLVKSTQPRWTDMRIPKDEIFNIFRILGGIRTNI